MAEQNPGSNESSLVGKSWFRVAVIVVVVIAAFVFIRGLSIPKSFGQYGYYRGDNVDEWAAQPVKYSGGPETCLGCHADKQDTWGKGAHAVVGCETCHGPAADHQADPVKVKPVVPEGREFCALCHERNVARAGVIEQVEVESHNAGSPCAACHQPHSPSF